jgi:phage recombination protein Bet
VGTETTLAKQGTGAIAAGQRISPVVAFSQMYNVEPAKVYELLRGTVIKPDKSGRHASNEEVAAFIIVANQYGLNPFTREIHAFTDPQKGVVPIVGIDGWSKIVNSQERFDGCEFETHVDDKGRTYAITCAMHVKGRSHPVRVTEFLSECRRDTRPWSSHPNRMLRHKAFMQAARIAFSLSGICDEEEAEDVLRPERPERLASEIASGTKRVAARLLEQQKPALPATPAPPAESRSPNEELPTEDPGQPEENLSEPDPPETPDSSTADVIPPDATEIALAELADARGRVRFQCTVKGTRPGRGCTMLDVFDGARTALIKSKLDGLAVSKGDRVTLVVDAEDGSYTLVAVENA